MRSAVKSLLVVTAALGPILSSCSPGPTPAPTSATATTSPTQTPVPSPTAVPTATPVPLPEITLNPGDAYFSVDGTQRFVFLRNVAGVTPADYTALLDMAQLGGELVVRVGTDNSAMSAPSGYGYTPAGDIVDSWSASWESFFDAAEARGIYVIPTFTGWMNWNTTSPNTWATNPFNSANGGPAKNPSEFYRKASPTQELYLSWFKNVVTRWAKHKNILAWEVITEVNNINGIDEADGVYLFDQLAQVARDADPEHRPIMASLADIGEWPSFYSSKYLDILDYHPYPYTPTLDLGSKLLADTARLSAKYKKPIIIGESGLNALLPDDAQGSGELPNAEIGMEHAIWSEAVSGVMDGRALYWEDSFAIYFSSLGWPYLEKYADMERPVAEFVSGVDMAGFKRLSAAATGKITGAVLGDGSMMIGWYRDSSCQPPQFKMLPVVSKQTVTVTVPEAAASWRVDFYDTTTGTTILGSITVTRKGNTIAIPLPDFKNDIAFKAQAQ